MGVFILHHDRGLDQLDETRSIELPFATADEDANATFAFHCRIRGLATEYNRSVRKFTAT